MKILTALMAFLLMTGVCLADVNYNCPDNLGIVNCSEERPCICVNPNNGDTWEFKKNNTPIKKLYDKYENFNIDELESQIKELKSQTAELEAHVNQLYAYIKDVKAKLEFEIDTINQSKAGK